MQVMLALAGFARREPPGFRGFRACCHDARNRIMRELREYFRIARFLKRTSDYANLFRMQGMLALARRARRQPPGFRGFREF
jgi:hypothetical protein